MSFVRGLRRVRDALLSGVPAWVLNAGQVASYLLERLAQCRLQQQPHKLAHEPRQVRRRPQVYPALKGDRDIARHQVLAQLGLLDLPKPDQAVPVIQQPQAQQKAA